MVVLIVCFAAIVFGWLWLRGSIFAAFVLFWPAEWLLLEFTRAVPDADRYSWPAVFFMSVMLMCALGIPRWLIDGLAEERAKKLLVGLPHQHVPPRA